MTYFILIFLAIVLFNLWWVDLWIRKTFWPLQWHEIKVVSIDNDKKDMNDRLKINLHNSKGALDNILIFMNQYHYLNAIDSKTLEKITKAFKKRYINWTYITIDFGEILFEWENFNYFKIKGLRIHNLVME